MIAPVGLTVTIERVLMELSMLIAERPSLARERFENIGAVIGKAIPGPGPCSKNYRKKIWRYCCVFFVECVQLLWAIH